MIAGILYASVCTRLDESFEVAVVARQMHAPCRWHLVFTKIIVRYLAGTSKQVLFYGRIHGTLEPLTGYSYSDWAGCSYTRKSTSDVVVTVYNSHVH